MRGIVADLPTCKEAFYKNIQRENLLEKILFTPLDFFKNDFPHVDLIMMGHVLHNWPVETQNMLV
jgi:hypothetical protein